MTSSFQNFDPNRLAKLMDLDARVESVGQGTDLTAILAHQLISPLEAELDRLAPDIVRKHASATPPLITFSDLFHHPNPPVELLDLVKRFAKQYSEQSGGHLPHEVASVFYFGSIALAILRCQIRISDLDLPTIQKGVIWAAKSPWVGAALPRWFEDISKSLRNCPTISQLPEF